MTTHPRARLACLLFALAVNPTLVLAQPADRTFTAGTAGAFTWEVNGNWSPWAGANPRTAYPKLSGISPDIGDDAVIGDATDARTITTTTTLGIGAFDMAQSSSAVNKLLLGGNLTPTYGLYTSFTNTSGSAANLVMDLNSFTFNVQTGSLTLPAMQILSTTPGGVFNIGGGTIAGNLFLGAGATLKMRGAFSVNNDVLFDPASLLLISGTSPITNTNNPGQLPTYGNVQIGQAPDPASSWRNLATISTVQGNVLVSRSTDFITISTNAVLAVKGNFTDHSATGFNVTNYPAFPNNTLAFYGNPVTPSTITIDSGQMNNVHLRIGDNGADLGGLASNVASAGRVRLGADLSTNLTATIRTGSSLDVQAYTLTAATFVSESGAIYTFTAGPDSGLIVVNGNLTLGNFTLNVVRGGNWDYLHDLVLFTYTGSFSGSPSLTLGNVPGGFTYSSLVTTGGTVKLTNVGLPEPATGMILMGGMALLGRRRRGK